MAKSGVAVLPQFREAGVTNRYIKCLRCGKVASERHRLEWRECTYNCFFDAKHHHRGRMCPVVLAEANDEWCVAHVREHLADLRSGHRDPIPAKAPRARAHERRRGEKIKQRNKDEYDNRRDDRAQGRPAALPHQQGIERSPIQDQSQPTFGTSGQGQGLPFSNNGWGFNGNFQIPAYPVYGNLMPGMAPQGFPIQYPSAPGYFAQNATPYASGYPAAFAMPVPGYLPFYGYSQGTQGSIIGDMHGSNLRRSRSPERQTAEDLPANSEKEDEDTKDNTDDLSDQDRLNTHVGGLLARLHGFQKE